MDVRTLFFVEASLLFLFGLTMIVNSIGQTWQRGTYWFAASNFCGAIGLVLHSADPTGPKIINMVLANLFLFVELCLINKAVAEFVERGRNLWIALLVFSGAVLGYSSYVTLWHPNTVQRLQSISLVIVATSLCSAALLFRYPANGTRVPTFTAGTLLLIYATTNLLRLAGVVWNPALNFYHIWLDRTLVAGLSFGYLWMTAARFRRDLENQASTDVLTGTLNRRAIERETQRFITRERTASHATSALMLDVDYFKEINDTYGHHAGDLALRAVADCLRQTMRTGDLIARLGGDEFLVIMPGTPLDFAHLAAERLRKRLATLRVPTETGSFGIQASIGITCLDTSTLELEDLMKLGDRALYAAKATNRRPLAHTPPDLAAAPQTSSPIEQLTPAP